MAKFCARVRKREGLPVDVHEGHLRASDDQEPGGGVRDRRGRGRGEPGRDSHPDPAAGSDPGPVGGAAQASTRQYLMCGALQLLSFLGYAWAVALVGARAYEWISAAKGYEEIYLRSVVFGGAGFIVLCTASDPGQVGAHRQVEAPADPHLESGILPLLGRQDAGQVEPPGLVDRRLAAVHVVSAGAGRQGRAGDGDLHPARAGLHRPAHHRPGHGDPQGVVLRLLPGLRGLDPDRPGHHRPERVHRREDRARHQHLDGRRVAARPRLLTAQRPAGRGPASAGTGPRPSAPT